MMKIKMTKKLPIILGVVILLLSAVVFAGAIRSQAATEPVSVGASAETTGQSENGNEVSDGEAAAALLTAAAMSDTGSKALAAAIAVGLAAAAGAVAMGIAIAKSAEGISRQPEAEGSIRTSLMLGLVFIETAIIYALIVAILIIFVM